MATGFLYGSHGNNTRGKSKKKTLKDYNLYLKETSSQSEDNVETESLISLREETSDLSFSGHNKFEDSYVDGYFRPQLRLKSPTRLQYPSIVGDKERENGKCEKIVEADGFSTSSCSIGGEKVVLKYVNKKEQLN